MTNRRRKRSGGRKLGKVSQKKFETCSQEAQIVLLSFAPEDLERESSTEWLPQETRRTSLPSRRMSAGCSRRHRLDR